MCFIDVAKMHVTLNTYFKSISAFSNVLPQNVIDKDKCASQIK